MMRYITVGSGLVAVLLVLAIVSMGVGAVRISPGEVWLSLTGVEEGPMQIILQQFRLPRIITGILVGAGLAVAGTLLQGMIRNPLVSPDVIGLTKGAGLAASLFILLFPKAAPGVLPFAAFAGAGLAGLLLLALSAGKRMNPVALALSGIGISAIFTAGIQYITVKNASDANTALLWLAGSLWGRGWEHVIALACWLLPLLPIVFLLARRLDILSLGPDAAESLGLQVGRTRIVLLICAVLITGVCTAVAGAIGFVGLIAPHMARRLVGPRHRLLLPLAAYSGAMLVLAADLIGRVLIVPKEVPAGIVCAVIGAPYFLALLRRQSRKGVLLHRDA
ncbi:FecCD family ABC transporter permease [Paenibacillus hamazuiensis]|uniref:FecCD family ABC transporter permease n=1 Tax=Paenibacillus hamazuiensis TaxID=2936508 RepID=UPI00200EBD93|nr:iron ABC transporter permease [Paenibacillus hamazuiensis]